MGYRGKLAEQQRARELRAQGWTMPEIAAELGVSKGSVSLWTRHIEIPRDLQRPRRPPRKRRPNKLEQAKQLEVDQLNASGRDRIGSLCDRDLLITGVALYAGEGSKRDGQVGFANTDPQFISLFCRWLRRFFPIDESRLRIHLYLHADLSLQAAIEHWSAVTRIPSEQFYKPYRAATDPTLRTTKHEFGCCTVRYCCSRTHRAIMGLVRAVMTAPIDVAARNPGTLPSPDPG